MPPFPFVVNVGPRCPLSPPGGVAWPNADVNPAISKITANPRTRCVMAKLPPRKIGFSVFVPAADRMCQYKSDYQSGHDAEPDGSNVSCPIAVARCVMDLAKQPNDQMRVFERILTLILGQSVS
jgi:hypothetical protein